MDGSPPMKECNNENQEERFGLSNIPEATSFAMCNQLSSKFPWQHKALLADHLLLTLVPQAIPEGKAGPDRM